MGLDIIKDREITTDMDTETIEDPGIAEVIEIIEVHDFMGIEGEETTAQKSSKPWKSPLFLWKPRVDFAPENHFVIVNFAAFRNERRLGRPRVRPRRFQRQDHEQSKGQPRHSNADKQKEEWIQMENGKLPFCWERKSKQF